MRILYLNPCGQMGGAETSLRELLASIRAAQPEWDLWLVLAEDGPLAGKARELGVKVVVEPFPPALAKLGDAGLNPFGVMRSLPKAIAGTMRYRRRLARIYRAVLPDVIHTNGLKMHLLGCWTRPRGTPVVWHIHDYLSRRPLMSRLLGRSRKVCAAAIANSESVASDLKALMPDLKVAKIYNAVDFDRFAPTGKTLDLDACSGLPPAPPDTVKVGLVATFARWKGHRVFLEALSQLPSGLAIRGYVIGGPIYQTSGSQYSLSELRQLADRLGLAGKIGFTGFVDDTAPAMRSLDIVVHASTQPEPFGMVIVEGMACERAVIASRAGGACELFVEGREALAHSPGNATALAQQIMRLAGDGKLRSQMGKAGRATARQLYHGQRLALELLELYRTVSRSDAMMACEPLVTEPGLVAPPPSHLRREPERVGQADPTHG